MKAQGAKRQRIPGRQKGRPLLVFPHSSSSLLLAVRYPSRRSLSVAAVALRSDTQKVPVIKAVVSAP